MIGYRPVNTRFKGKAVLIVGGSSGIGLAAAKGFRDEGANVAITGRTAETLQAAARQLGVTAIHGDIADLGACRASVDQAAAALGRIDVLFVNAGVASLAKIGKLTPDEWDRCHAVNLKGCIFAIQAALPHMSDGGAIVTSGSVGSEMAVPGSLAYATAKAALRAATRILAAELAPRRIRVNMIGIGPTKTELYKRGAAAEKVAATEAMLAADNPLGRMADPAEIARAVLFLSSDEASFITGSNFPVDGGLGEIGRVDVSGLKR